jgi:hypothetical protein
MNFCWQKTQKLFTIPESFAPKTMAFKTNFSRREFFFKYKHGYQRRKLKNKINENAFLRGKNSQSVLD